MRSWPLADFIGLVHITTLKSQFLWYILLCAPQEQMIIYVAEQLQYLYYRKGRYEPRHDKTNKVTVRPAKIQIILGIRPVWSESSLCA